MSQSIRLTVSAKVRELLSRHGALDQRQQLPLLMGALDASYSQAYRKLSGRSAWLDEDLYRIAEHFGETLGTLFSDAAKPDDSHAAIVMFGDLLLRCQVTVHEDKSAASPLVLENAPGGLRVVPHGAVSGQLIGPIRHMTLSPGQPPHSSGVAVLDDDTQVADAITDDLLARGIDAQAYYHQADLMASPRRYDTYILDWYAGDGTTALDLVHHLRDKHAPEAPIVILTGQIHRGSAESDLARLIQTHGVLVEVKPIRLDLLLAKVEHARADRLSPPPATSP